MPTIEKCSEYNARITKIPDFKSKTHGYNFSYPVMNSIDICNLFISGGETEASAGVTNLPGCYQFVDAVSGMCGLVCNSSGEEAGPCTTGFVGNE